MNQVVYSNKGLLLIRVGNGFIVYNTKKEFSNGHTHLKSRSAAIDAINFVVHGMIPRRCGLYYLKSLARISNDQKYIDKVEELIGVRTSKGNKQKYKISRKFY